MKYLVDNVMEESVSNLEFMFNFDDIVSKGQNDEYRYKFKKNATKITEKKTFHVGRSILCFIYYNEALSLASLF